MDSTYELSRNGSLVTLTIKDHDYDVVEYSITKKLVDINGKVIIDSTNQMFFSNREFKDFFEPIVNDLKVRFENADSI